MELCRLRAGDLRQLATDDLQVPARTRSGLIGPYVLRLVLFFHDRMPTVSRRGAVSDVQHKHEAVRSHVLGLIRDGLAPKDRLPTERELSETLGVSRLTIRRALSQLAEEGLVYRVQGAGTFVASPTIRKGESLTSFTEDMKARGLKPSAFLLLAEETVAGAYQSWNLEVSPGEPLFHLRRLRLADDVPMCLEDVHIVRKVAPDLLDQPLEGSLYDLLSTTYQVHVDRVVQSVNVTVLDASDARELAVPALAPAFSVERVTYDRKGRSIELAKSLYRGDRYSFDRTLRRLPPVS